MAKNPAASAEFTYVLRPGWTAAVIGNDLVVTSDSKSFRIRSPLRLPSSLPATLAKGVPPLPLGAAISRGAVQLLIRKLAARGVVERVSLKRGGAPRKPRSALDAYWAHIGSSSERARERLRTARVIILGLGGLGSVIIQHLIGAGVRHFGLVDHDVVRRDNLERQFIYGTATVGTPKALAARDYILDRLPSADVTVSRRRLRGKRDFVAALQKLGRPTICIVCIDEPPVASFEASSRFLWREGVPFLQGGVLTTAGFFGPLFDSSRSLHPPDAFSLRPRDRRRRYVGFTTPAYPPYNTVIGSLMAAAALHYLAGATDRVDFDLRSYVDLSAICAEKIQPFAGRVATDSQRRRE